MKRGDRKPPSRSYVMRHHGGASVAFVPDPENAGRWLRVSPCVVFKDCSQCKVRAGTPCRSKNGYACSHHYVRSDGFRLASFTQLAQRQIILDSNFVAKETE